MEPQDDTNEDPEDGQGDAKEDQEDGQEKNAVLVPVRPNPEFPDEIRLGRESFCYLSDEMWTNPVCRMRSGIFGRDLT